MIQPFSPQETLDTGSSSPLTKPSLSMPQHQLTLLRLLLREIPCCCGTLRITSVVVWTKRLDPPYSPSVSQLLHNVRFFPILYFSAQLYPRVGGFGTRTPLLCLNSGSTLVEPFQCVVCFLPCLLGSLRVPYFCGVTLFLPPAWASTNFMQGPPGC